MLWHAQRYATHDVDSARRFDTDLGEAIELVGTRHNLQEGWLNDNAVAFWPANASYDECHVVLQHAALIVRVPDPEVIFVMKLYRADPQDREDLILLWPRCGFADAHTAAQVFRLAYPHAPKMNTWRATSPTSPERRRGHEPRRLSVGGHSLRNCHKPSTFSMSLRFSPAGWNSSSWFSGALGPSNVAITLEQYAHVLPQQ